MYVVGAAFEISFVTNGVLPEALLPKGIFTAMIARNWRTRSDDTSHEASLDPAPPV
jgi:hypothetical protein